MNDSIKRFGFLELEVPWALGLADGRYLMREEAIIVVRTMGAAERRRLGSRRPKAVEGEPEPEPVPTTRLTVIGVEPLGDDTASQAWLRTMSESPDDLVEWGVGRIGRLLELRRVVSGDPGVRSVAREDALRIRVGIGTGDELATGVASERVALPPPGRKSRRERTSALRPDERLTAVLAGRDEILTCELLMLDARRHCDAGFHSAAAFVLRDALTCAATELADVPEHMGARKRAEDVVARVEEVAALATGADPDDEQTELIEEILGRLEAAMRARSASAPWTEER